MHFANLGMDSHALCKSPQWQPGAPCNKLLSCPLMNGVLWDNPIITHYVGLPVDGFVLRPGTFFTEGLRAHNYNLVKIILIFMIQSNHNFAHVMTAQLSWHVQNCNGVRPLVFFYIQYVYLFDICIILFQTICTILLRRWVVNAHLRNVFIFIKLHYNHQLLQWFTGKLLW